MDGAPIGTQPTYVCERQTVRIIHVGTPKEIIPEDQGGAVRKLWILFQTKAMAEQTNYKLLLERLKKEVIEI